MTLPKTTVSWWGSGPSLCALLTERNQKAGTDGGDRQRYVRWCLALVLALWMLEALGGSSLSFAKVSRHHQTQMELDQWEGSVAGVAYSEFNHHLAGASVLLVGLSELRVGLCIAQLAWARFLLPLGLLGAGAYLLIWSDHDAWPIGSLSLAETLFGGDLEILQHKIYAVVLLGIGTIEFLLRIHRIRQGYWKMVLPGFTILGGLSLLIHMHGPHPAAHKIMVHHIVLGVLAMLAGVCFFLASSASRVGHGSPEWAKWMTAYASLILIIGVLLITYSE